MRDRLVIALFRNSRGESRWDHAVVGNSTVDTQIAYYRDTMPRELGYELLGITVLALTVAAEVDVMVTRPIVRGGRVHDVV